SDTIEDQCSGELPMGFCTGTELLVQQGRHGQHCHVPTDGDADFLKETPAREWPAASVIDALYREEVLEARAMSPEEKFLAGEELFLYACAITLGGIRNQHPELSEAEQRRMLEERLALGEELEMGS